MLTIKTLRGTQLLRDIRQSYYMTGFCLIIPTRIYNHFHLPSSREENNHLFIIDNIRISINENETDVVNTLHQFFRSNFTSLYLNAFSPGSNIGTSSKT